MKIRRLRFSLPMLVVKVSGAVAAIAAASRRSRRAPPSSRAWGDRHHHVHALAARGLDEGHEAERLELAPDVHRRLDHLAPGDAFAGVEVEDDAVGLLQPGVRRPRCGTRPRRTGPAPDSPWRPRPRYRSWSRPRSWRLEGGERRRHAGEGVALEEAVLRPPGRAAHQRLTGRPRLRQHEVADRGVVDRDVELGRPGPAEEPPRRVGHPDRGEVSVGDQPLARGGGPAASATSRRPLKTAWRSELSVVRLA